MVVFVLMALDVRQTFLIGIAVLLFSKYYLEKQYSEAEIYWIYAILSLILGLMSAFTVITDHPSRGNFIPLTALSITLAIIYYHDEDKVNVSS